MTRDEVLALELDRALEAERVRVVALATVAGDGSTPALVALADRLRARRVDVALLSAELAGATPGGGLDAWLRVRLGLPPVLDDDALEAALRPHLAGLEASTVECLRVCLGLGDWRLGSPGLEGAARRGAVAGELERWLFASNRPFAVLVDDAAALDDETLAVFEHLAHREHRGAALVLLALRGAPLDPRAAGRLAALREARRLVDRALPALSQRERARAPAPASSEAPLSVEAQRVVTALRLGGGQLPVGALQRVLDAEPAERGLAELQARRLVARGPTRRFPSDVEVALRDGRADPTPVGADAAVERPMLEALVAWARERVRPEERAWPDRAPLVLSVLARGTPLRDVPVDAPSPAAGVPRLACPACVASLASEALASQAPRDDALRAAFETAQGVRRLVLGRRLVEALRARGRLLEAHAVLAQCAASVQSGRLVLADGWETVLFAPGCDPLDRWDRLSEAEARAALALAEHELSSPEARRSPPGGPVRSLERRLASVAGEAGAALRLRWTLGWARQRLAQGGDAREIAARCRAVRAASGAASDSAALLELLEVEERARLRAGALDDARELVDLRITLAKARGDRRAECSAWRSRGLLAHGVDRLDEARRAFEASLQLARGLAQSSDETTAWHELGVVQSELGEHAAALELHRTAVVLAERRGDAAGRCRAALGLALAELGRLDLRGCEVALSRARRLLEPGTNPALRAWLRLLEGERLLTTCFKEPDALLLARARHELAACVDLLEECPADDRELFEPAEAVAVAALTLRLSGQGARAKELLQHGVHLASGRPSAQLWLTGARETLAGRRPDDALGGFEALRFRRAEEHLEQLLHALGLTAAPAA